MKTIEIKPCSGAINLIRFFPNFPGEILMHPFLQTFFVSKGLSFIHPESSVFQVDEAQEGLKFGDILGYQPFLSVPQVCALLAFFGSEEGWPLLSIPQGQEEEVNMLLGWVEIKAVEYVLYIEYKKKGEIHLYLSRPKNTGRGKVLFLQVLSPPG